MFASSMLISALGLLPRLKSLKTSGIFFSLEMWLRIFAESNFAAVIINSLKRVSNRMVMRLVMMLPINVITSEVLRSVKEERELSMIPPTVRSDMLSGCREAVD